VTPPRIPSSYCDCNYKPVRGIAAGRHLPSCRYGIIEDYLEAVPPTHPQSPYDPDPLTVPSEPVPISRGCVWRALLLAVAVFWIGVALIVGEWLG
jgi:hypothetical protein